MPLPPALPSGQDRDQGFAGAGAWLLTTLSASAPPHSFSCCDYAPLVHRRPETDRDRAVNVDRVSPYGRVGAERQDRRPERSVQRLCRQWRQIFGRGRQDCDRGFWRGSAGPEDRVGDRLSGLIFAFYCKCLCQLSVSGRQHAGDTASLSRARPPSQGFRRTRFAHHQNHPRFADEH